MARRSSSWSARAACCAPPQLALELFDRAVAVAARTGQLGLELGDPRAGGDGLVELGLKLRQRRGDRLELGDAGGELLAQRRGLGERALGLLALAPLGLGLREGVARLPLRGLGGGARLVASAAAARPWAVVERASWASRAVSAAACSARLSAA